MQTYDAIVLGVGAAGSAALAELARRGVRALGIDRYAPGHDHGSSHGQTRMIRLAYFEHPGYVPLLREAWRLWHKLEASQRTQLLFDVGLIEIGPANGEVVPGVLRAARDYDLAVERLSAREIERRFAGFRVPESLVGVFERQAGYLLVELAVQALAAEAQRLGAELRIGETVRGWQVDGNSVTVETDGGRYSAARLIVAAGAWSGALLADLGLPLTVLRKQIQWWRPLPGGYEVQSGTPTFLYELPEGLFYGFPAIDERGVKIAEHSGGTPVADPSAVDRRLDAEDCRRVAAFRGAYLPDCSDQLTGHGVCFYTLTPDRHFIIDRHPAHPHVAFCAGLSGHGFKFAPLLGQLLVQLALDGRTSLPIDFLSLGRPALASVPSAPGMSAASQP